MKRFFLGLLLGIPALSSAQSNFQKGYIINNTRDTLKGYIDYKEWSLNPSSINFKTDLDAGIQEVTVKNLLAYSIDGFESFQKHEVDISMSKVELNQVSVGPDTSKKRDIVFLKVLQTGKNVTLFSYTDGIKQRFYLLEKDGLVPYELSSQLYMKSDTENILIRGTGYIRQLSSVMTKLNVGTDDNRRRLRYLSYNEKDLMNIVAAINEQQLVKAKPGLRFFAGAGLNISKAVYKGDIIFAGKGAVSKTSYSPMITIGVDLLANPAIGKLIYRLESALLMSKNEVSINTNQNGNAIAKHAFDQVTINFTPQVIYNFYNTNRLKIFAGGGLGLNFSTYSNNKRTAYDSYRNENTVTDNAVEMEKFNFSLPFTAGVVIHKRVEISAGYAFSSSITNYAGYSINIQRYRMGVNYLFGKH